MQQLFGILELAYLIGHWFPYAACCMIAFDSSLRYHPLTLHLLSSDLVHKLFYVYDACLYFSKQIKVSLFYHNIILIHQLVRINL